jgi:NADH-quinone oxidoreductase subunit L
MFRLLFVVFFGPGRSEEADAAMEPPPVMLWPLMLLTVPSVLAGFWGIEHVYGVGITGMAPEVWEGGRMPWRSRGVFWRCSSGLPSPGNSIVARRCDPLPRRLGALADAMRDRFYLDELYRWSVIRVQEKSAKGADWFDRWLVAGLFVRGIHGTTEFAGRALRLVQTGNLQTYAFLIVLGLALVIYLATSR